jgi:solute:Na+ symporter, SSS family
MKPSMVGLSLFATLISTISYLAVPGEMIAKGPVTLLYIAAIPVVYLIVGFCLIPHITKLPITSAYELLDIKFGRAVRLFGSTVFLAIRLAWMGLVVLLSARVIVEAVGMDESRIPLVMAAIGAVTVIYSSMGGLRAVVLTDAIQCVILFGGAVLCVIMISVKMGGFSWFPTEWSPNWDKQPIISFDPTVRVTVFGTLVATTLWWICTAGSDQMAIQRYLATRDAKAARKAFLVNNIADVMVATTLGLLGFALLGFFTQNGHLLVDGKSLEGTPDFLFPYFIVRFMHYGLAGLVISGMLAAAMSSLSSGVNSATTVINTDFLGHFLGERYSEEVRIQWAKWIAVAVGVAVLGVGLLVGNIEGNIIEVTGKTSNLFVAPLFSLFFLALFVPFSTSLGAMMGCLYGLLAAYLVGFWHLTGGPTLSFQWISFVALSVSVSVGCLVSLIPYKGRPQTYKIVVTCLCLVPFVLIVCAFVSAYLNNVAAG